MKRILTVLLVLMLTLLFVGCGLNESPAPNSRVISHVNPGLDSGGSAML